MNAPDSGVRPGRLTFDAVILCGGRSSRLNGFPKSDLELDGLSLLERTCEAVGAAERVVVVGSPASGVPDQAELIREDPPFGGPAAAVAAAVAELHSRHAPWTLVLACDMPQIAKALPALLGAAHKRQTSVLAHDGGRDQPLAALYRWDDLSSAGEGEAVRNLSMRALLARVQWSAVEVPAGSTRDVDTWADARELGVERPEAGE